MDKTTAGIHKRLFSKYRAAVAAKAEPVCPDGKEKSVGLAISRFTAVFTSQGLALATKGFKNKLQHKVSKISATRMLAPARRVLGNISSVIEHKIHIAPPLPKLVIIGMTISKSPQRK